MAHTRLHRSLARPLNLLGTLLLVVGMSACSGKNEVRIDKVNPHVGHLRGGQLVEISGRNLRRDIGYTVYFGSKKATRVSILSERRLQAMTPSVEQAAVVDVLVRTDHGHAFRIAKAYEYKDLSGDVMKHY